MILFKMITSSNINVVGYLSNNDIIKYSFIYKKKIIKYILILNI